MGAEELSALHRFLDERGCGSRVARRGKVDAVVSENRVHLVGHGFDQVVQKVARHARCDLLMQLNKGELRCAVDGHEEIEAALLSPDLGDVDVEVADWVRLELAPARLLALRLGQPRDAVALKAAMQA
jgi:hypothetical protein